MRNLDKQFAGPEGPVPVLEKVNLTIGAGDAIGIMGPSGSGKSTLLHILGLLDSPTAGEVLWEGTNPNLLPEPEQATWRNEKIGFVFQEHILIPQLTALENVLVPLAVGPTDETAPARAKALLESLHLGTRMQHFPHQLSGGERQRVAIARALIRKPKLLLCDEPTGNLDAATSAEIVAALLELQKRQNTTLVVVTHSPEVCAQMARSYQVANRTLLPL